MKHIFVRPARQNEAEKFVEWSFQTENNLFDPKAALSPTSFTVCAFNESGPILFAPVQTPMFMEALAINPNATEMEKAAALKAVVQFLVSQGYIRGINEIYFLCADESTEKFAEKQAFQRMPWSLYRMKISDLEKEPKCESTPA